MLFYYRFLGLVADIALIIYGILLLGAVQRRPRHAHAARHRRHDPHHRRGGRRQRGHLRTHQGRGAPRPHRALGGQLRLRPRLSHHPRRQRPDPAHGGRDLRVRDRATQGLRLHPDARRARQHVHRRGRHARPARAAVRLHVLQPRRRSWASRPPTSTRVDDEAEAGRRPRRRPASACVWRHRRLRAHRRRRRGHAVRRRLRAAPPNAAPRRLERRRSRP